MPGIGGPGLNRPNTFRYFAYGSNMLTRRLAAADRCPSARPVATGHVSGRRLRFDKAGQDGSGKCDCDAEITGDDTDRVYGVAFEINSQELAALDRAEGLNRGYMREVVAVHTAVGAIDAMTYIAIRKEPSLQPYHWYKALAIAGAVEHGLPDEYVARIRSIESADDPDAARREKNEALLSG